MIDVHVLLGKRYRQDWLDQCLDSLTNQPCTVHLVEGFNAGHGYRSAWQAVAAGRAYGYSLGSAPYVSYVDSDDWVLPGALEGCLKVMKSGVKALTTLEYVYEGGTVVRTQPRHHLQVCRRDLLEPFLPTYTSRARGYACHQMIERLTGVRPHLFHRVCYAWRIDGYGAHLLPLN